MAAKKTFEIGKDIELGDQVKNVISGFKGLATARVEYINGCVQYLVQPSSYYIDDQTLIVISKNPKKLKTKGVKKPTGGPGHTPSGPSGMQTP